MPDIGTQLRRLSERLDSEYPDFELSEIDARISRDSRALAPRRFSIVPGWGIGLGAGLLVGLLIGVVPLLLGDDEMPPANTNVSTTAPVPTTSIPGTTLPTSSEDLSTVFDEGGWVASAPLTGDGEIKLWAITGGSSGLVAVGNETFGEPGSEVHVPAVWTSPDGLTWTRTDENNPGFSSAELWGGGLRAVTSFGSRLIAAGDFDCEAAMWISDDGGQSWVRVPNSAGLFGEELGGTERDCRSIGHLAVSNDRIVAVDADYHVFWESQNGEDWHRTSGDSPLGPNLAWIEHIAITDDVVVVAGNACNFPSDQPDEEVEADPTLGCIQTVWTSPDGSTWTPLGDQDNPFRGGFIDDLIRSSSGFVAVGSDGNANPWIWTSENGREWTRATLRADDPTTLNGLSMFLAGSRQDHLVALGYSADQWIAHVWVSTDGTTWHRQTGNDQNQLDTFFQDITITQLGLSAISQPNTGIPAATAIWKWAAS